MSWGASKAALVGALSGALVTCAIAATAPGAHAKSTYESPYGFERTWNAALRLVRVDNGWKVTEKDESSGYLLFEYTSPEARRPTSGSFEFVRAQDAVSVLVALPQMPQYHEQVLLDALAAKMRREYGDPPEHPHVDPQAPDASADAAPE